jgi:Sulfotransferase domain
VSGPCEAPILFMKDMAYQARPIGDPDFYAGFTNTFLIREPAEALLSLHRMWPDFTLQEAGFVEQAELFELVTETLEQPAVVVDATDFRSAPQEVMAAYCEAVDIPHRAAALRWQPGPVELWQGWSDWHRDAEQSAGIAPPPDPATAAAAALPPRVAAMVEVCRPHYERLHAARLLP